MQLDKTTLDDLSIFHTEEELSIFHCLNFTRTIGGKEWLRVLLSRPLDDLTQIGETQQLIQSIIRVHAQWPQAISNGTVMVMEKFYETQLEEIPRNSNIVNSFFYRLINRPDYSLIKYSVQHFITFIQGIKEIGKLLYTDQLPSNLSIALGRMNTLLNKPWIQEIELIKDVKQLRATTILKFGFLLRRHFKNEAFELIDLFSKLDAYYSLATACIKHQLQFPEFIQNDVPQFEARQLYHLLLPTPVAYDINLNQKRNFLFLTGANMAGKSTFIKAVGAASYLAHIGMAVPAQSLQLSLFDGLLSNIHVQDNLVKGESYFFNEVQRIRKTIEKISNGKKWLILIDELFKGTNVQDAMKCSTVVIEGLIKIRQALFILSTHLYEIGENLKQYPNIQFRYFQTNVENEQLVFNYQLKEGISNDRLGYLILKREGVIDMLEKL